MNVEMKHLFHLSLPTHRDRLSNLSAYEVLKQEILSACGTLSQGDCLSPVKAFTQVLNRAASLHM